MVEKLHYALKLFSFCLAFAQLFSIEVLGEKEKRCEVHAGCYHLRFKSPWCGEVSLPSNIPSYTSEVEVSACRGGSLKALQVTWVEKMKNGEIREFPNCRQMLSCKFDGAFLRQHLKHHIYVKIQLPKSRRRVYLKAYIYIRDLSKLSTSKKGFIRQSKAKGKTVKEHWVSISYGKVTDKQKLWGKVDKKHKTKIPEIDKGQPTEWSNDGKVQHLHNGKNPGNIIPKLWGRVEKQRKISLSSLRWKISPGTPYEIAKNNPEQGNASLTISSLKTKAKPEGKVSYKKKNYMKHSTKNHNSNGSSPKKSLNWQIANENYNTGTKRKLDQALKWHLINEKHHHIAARKQAVNNRQMHKLLASTKYQSLKSMPKFVNVGYHLSGTLSNHLGKSNSQPANKMNLHLVNNGQPQPSKSSYLKPQESAHLQLSKILNDDFRYRNFAPPAKYLNLHPMNDFKNKLPIKTPYQIFGKGYYQPSQNQIIPSTKQYFPSSVITSPYGNMKFYQPENGISSQFIYRLQEQLAFDKAVKDVGKFKLPYKAGNSGLGVSNQFGENGPLKSENMPQRFPFLTEKAEAWQITNSKNYGNKGQFFPRMPAYNSFVWHDWRRGQKNVYNNGYTGSRLTDINSSKQCEFLKNILKNAASQKEGGFVTPVMQNFSYLCRNAKSTRKKRHLNGLETPLPRLSPNSHFRSRANQGPYELKWYENFGNHNNSYFHGSIYWRLNDKNVRNQENSPSFPDGKRVAWNLRMEKMPANTIQKVGYGKEMISKPFNNNWQTAKSGIPYTGKARNIKPSYKNMIWQMATEKHHIPQNGKMAHVEPLEQNVNWQMASEKHHVPHKGKMALGKSIDQNVNWQMAMEKHHMPHNGKMAHIEPLEQNVNWQMALEKHHVPHKGKMAIGKSIDQNVNWKMAMEKHHMLRNGMMAHIEPLEQNVNWQSAMEKHHIPQNGKMAYGKPLEQNVNWQMALEKHHVPHKGKMDLGKSIDQNVNLQMEVEKHHMPHNEKMAHIEPLEQNVNWQMALEKHHVPHKGKMAHGKSVDMNVNWQMAMEKHHIPQKGNMAPKEEITLRNSVNRQWNLKKHPMPYGGQKKTTSQDKNMLQHIKTVHHISNIYSSNFGDKKDMVDRILKLYLLNKNNHTKRRHHSKRRSYSPEKEKNLNWYMRTEMHHPYVPAKNFIISGKAVTGNDRLQNNIVYHLAMEKVQDTPNVNMKSKTEHLYGSKDDKQSQIMRKNHPLAISKGNWKYSGLYEISDLLKGLSGVKRPANYNVQDLSHLDGAFWSKKPKIPGRGIGLTSGMVYRILDSKTKSYRLPCLMKDTNGIEHLEDCTKHNASTGVISSKEKEALKSNSNSSKSDIQNYSKILNEIRAEIFKFYKLVNITAKEMKTLQNASDLTVKTILKEAKWNHNLSTDGKYIQARVGDIKAEVLKRLYNTSYLAARKAVSESAGIQYHAKGPLKPATNSSGGHSVTESWHAVPQQHWGPWKSWSSCSVTCGIVGIQKRFRECIRGQLKTAMCNGTSAQARQCKINKRCPDDSFWTHWSAWSNCSAKCGSGNKVRYRSCQRLGKRTNNCKGQRVQVKTCNMRSCPKPTTSTLSTTTMPKAVNGSWTSWSKWSECSVKCGLGNRTRKRRCGPDYLYNLFPKSRVSCKGKNTEFKTCILESCEDPGLVHKVLQGEETVLHCQYDHNKINSNKIYWITPAGRRVTSKTNNSRFEMVDGALRLKNIQKRDGGFYHCIIVGNENSMLGMDTQIDVTTCMEDPCQNGASCIEEKYSHHSHHRHFKCLCPPGLYGSFCQKRKSPSQMTVIIISVSILAVAMVIAGISTCIICCRKKQGKKEYREEEMSPVISKKMKSGKRSRSQSRESLHLKGAKSPKSCPALLTTPDRGHKTLNSSIVCSDDSVIEIDEKDFKHFREDNVFDMYMKKETGTTETSALTGESGINTSNISNGASPLFASPGRTSRMSKFKDNQEQRAKDSSWLPSRETEKKLDSIYENSRDYSFAGNFAHEPIEGFRVSFKDQDFESYHRSFEEPSFQYSTPVKGGNMVDIDFDSGGLNTTYETVESQQHRDFEMNHHIQCSPMDSGYSQTPIHEKNQSQRINDRSNNERRGKFYRSRQTEQWHRTTCLLPGHDLGCHCQLQWQPCSEMLWPYDEKEAIHFEQDVMNYQFSEHLRKLDPQYQYESEAGDSTVSQFDDSSYQHLVNKEEIPSDQGSPVNSSTKRSDSTVQIKSPFALDLEYVVDNFCEPVSTQITDTSSCETVRETEKVAFLHSPINEQKEATEMSNNQEDQPNQADQQNQAGKDFDLDPDQILKECEMSTEFLSIIDSETVQTGSEKFLSADDISKTDLEEADDDGVEFTSHSDTEITANLSVKNPSMKQPNERLCIDHFQMVYGTLSYKSPESARQEEEKECDETDDVTDGDV